MIVTSTPLRISLVGGSTDHPQFLEKYGSGSVISFPSSLRTYVSIHQDVFGSNSLDHNYVLSYSRREEVKELYEIQNELIRYCFEELKVSSINCSLTSDVYSAGSGLASSSAYLLSLIAAIHTLRSLPINSFEICQLAAKIEKKFNPLVGQQDFYGSLPFLKKITFSKTDPPTFKYLSTKIFEKLDMHLIYTGVVRSSTSILKEIDVDKSYELLHYVKQLEEAITQENQFYFCDIIKNAWKSKKETSSLICENAHLRELDLALSHDPEILAHKLCGAGNGGYFLIFTEKGVVPSYTSCKQIKISDTGFSQYEFR